jgi:hypothetical protein
MKKSDMAGLLAWHPVEAFPSSVVQDSGMKIQQV